MPTRFVSLAIVLFWTLMTGLLLYWEVWPHYRSGDAPPYHIDLTEQVGSNLINWTVSKQDNPDFGFAKSQVETNPDQTYVLSSEIRFNDYHLAGLKLRKFVTRYHITNQGRLLDISIKGYFRASKDPQNIPDQELSLVGEVVEGVIRPRFSLGNLELPKTMFGDLAFKAEGNVLNPLQPLNRIVGLSAGRTWLVPSVEPLDFMGSAMLGQRSANATLQAQVVEDTLTWDDDEVACYRIDYLHSDKGAVAKTWVRRRDGLVLQQEAKHGTLDLTLHRVPVK